MAKFNPATGEVTFTQSELVFIGASIIYGPPDDTDSALYETFIRMNERIRDWVDDSAGDVDDYEDELFLNSLFEEPLTNGNPD
jgi:hypothetical protein